ncbi:acetyltransferase [Brucella melitensis]|nr:acetyltransferase [Brucella melitensis]KDZ98988.1 acetyltransferase [Brucella melitensis]
MVVEEESYEASCCKREADYADASPGLEKELGYVLDCPILVTERLVLRPPHAEDVDAISYLANNARVSSMLARMPHPYTRENALDFVGRVRKGEMGNCIYAITQAETGFSWGAAASIRTNMAKGWKSVTGWGNPIGATALRPRPLMPD